MKIIYWRLLSFVVALMLAAPVHSLAQTFLSPNEAFNLKVSRQADGDLVFAWTIAPDHYLYRDHTVATTPGGEVAVPLRLQAGEKKDDPGFGVVDIWRNSGRAVVSAAELARAGAPASINITYQGCLEDSICYPPMTRTVDVPTTSNARIAPREAEALTAQAAAVLALQAPVTGAETQSTPEAAPAAAAPSPSPAVAQQDQGFVAGLADKGGVAWVLLAFFGFGVLLAFTPCVFPMYPILAGVIGRGVDGRGTRRGLLLSSAYVLGLATAFALLGVAAAWSGQNLQMALQSVWAVGGLSLIFLVLAASMFGGFELQLPSAWTSRLSRDSGAGRRSVTSAAGLGFVSALIVGPCVTAPLAGALLYIAQTGDVLLGALALFFLGLGKGVPLIIFGTAGARFLPKAGAWMDRVKMLFGFVFLGMAWWLASRILPPAATLALGAGLCLSAAAALGLFRPLTTSVPAGLARAAGLALAVWGVLLLIGLSLDASSPWRPLAPLTRTAGLTATAAPSSIFTVTDSAALTQAMARATERNRPAVIYFTADWCVSCRVIEREVFENDAVLVALGSVDLIKVDVTRSTPETGALMEDYCVVGPPTLAFFTPEGIEAPQTRLVGEVSAHKVLAALDRLGVKS